MATPRRLLMNPAFSEVFHCTSRCVRRAFLCGWDPASGRDFEHRRLWIDERISELALYFGISVISSSVMSNHFHIILRTEPQWVASLSDAEVARRWLCVFPGPGGRRGHPPEAQAIEDLCLDTKKLALCRSRLSDISWFMRSLNEPIARRANAEDECTGRFWEGRFKCRRLDGDAAIHACLIYFDLNPVRAGMVAEARQHPWSSHRHYIGQVSDRRLSPPSVYWGLGNTPFAREAAYTELVHAGQSMAQQGAITDATLHGWALGDAAFTAELQKRTPRRITPAKPGRPPSTPPES